MLSIEETKPFEIIPAKIYNLSYECTRTLFDTSPLGIVYLDSDGTVLDANHIIMNMIGHDRHNNGKNIGEKLRELLDLNVDGNNKKIIQHLLDGEAISVKEIEYTTPTVAKKWFNINATPYFGPDEKVSGAVLLCEDITGYKELEAQLLHAQKMESVGQLASGVVHDFNNLLTVINGHVELAMLVLEPEDRIYQELIEVQKAATRAATLTQRLLAFARKGGSFEPKDVELNTIISDMERMLRRIIGENIELETHLFSELWKLKIVPSQIEHILINLVVNARDAMSEGGKLIIRTTNSVLEQNFINGEPEIKPGNYVKFEVIDNGCGISEDDKKELFKPFFTTKSVGKGTGLGLSIVYGLVKQNNGYIWVESELNRGTTFEIYIPVGQDRRITRTSREAVVDSIPQGNERVLVVEDEDAVRDMAISILTKFGYDVHAACCGDDAMRQLKSKGKPFELILADFLLPDINGIELADKLRKQCPDTKVLIMSGYGNNLPNNGEISQEYYPYIEKPFRVAALAGKVREVLNS